MPAALRLLFESRAPRGCERRARHESMVLRHRAGRSARRAAAASLRRRAAAPRRPRIACRARPRRGALHEPHHERPSALSTAPRRAQRGRTRRGPDLHPRHARARLGASRRGAVARRKARSGAMGPSARPSADAQRGAPSREHRSSRSADPSRRRARRRAARARQHAVPRVGSPEPKLAPTNRRAGRNRARRGECAARAPHGPDGDPVRLARLLCGQAARLHGGLGAPVHHRDPRRARLALSSSNVDSEFILRTRHRSSARRDLAAQRGPPRISRRGGPARALCDL